MERQSNVSTRSDQQEEIFHSLISANNSNRPSHQPTGNKLNRPTVYTRPKKNRQSKKNQLSDIYESQNQLLLQDYNLQSELVTKEKQPKCMQERRIDILQMRPRPDRKHQKHACSFDTSATLIKLMEDRKWIRYLMNIYIWLNICLRIGYVGFVIFYVIENSKIDTADNEKKMSEFYYWILGSFLGIRVLFILIIYKLLSIGNKTRDIRIKIVYDTYDAWFKDTSKERNELQYKCDQMIVRNAQDELILRGLQQQVKSLTRWLWVLKTYIVLIPPECQFILIKKSNGFFQVQNFIMKTLEIFFFTPQLMYFILVEDKINFNDIYDYNFFQLDFYSICNLVQIADVCLFFMITIILICLGNSKRLVSRMR